MEGREGVTVERYMRGGVSGIGCQNHSGALDTEFQFVAGIRDKHAGPVQYVNRYIRKVFSAIVHRGHCPGSFSRGAHFVARPLAAVPVGNNLNGAGSIADIVPNDSVAGLGLAPL